MINCSLGNDGVANPGDICTVTCDNGYELTGSDTGICQNDGSWSGGDATCSIGEWLLVLSWLGYYVAM